MTRGGYLHNDISVDQLDAAWRSIGASTRREIAIFDAQGKIFGYTDLLARLGPYLIAVEVELSPKRVARDLEKALALAATELWIVAPNVRVRRSIHRSLQRLGPEPKHGIVFVLTLGQALQRVRHCFSMFSGVNAGEKQIETEGKDGHGS